MTLGELKRRLRKFTQDDLPIQIQRVDDGITFAEDLDLVIRADPADGDRYWIISGQVHKPEWSRH